MTEQVQTALETVEDFPVGRLWLDAEAPVAGQWPSQIIDKLEEAVAACGSMECGIYTAGWWWVPATADSDALAHLPLWYAHYDDNPSLDTWSWQSFGGWQEPTAKQFQERYVCGLNVDENTMRVEAEPPPPPEPLPAPGTGVPSTPVGLYPDDALDIHTESARLLCDAVPGAAQYAFEIERYSNDGWKPYFTYLSWDNSRRFNPIFGNTAYRWRVRGRNPSGWGAWSSWALFAYGNPPTMPDLEPTDPEEPPPEEPPEEPPPEEPPVAGAPTGLSPTGGAIVSTSGVALSCEPMSGAARYAFEIEHFDSYSQSYEPYYTYEGTVASRTFYPVYHGRDFRFRVRARVDGDWTPDSSWSIFHYE
jgi:hypothetical protein